MKNHTLPLLVLIFAMTLTGWAHSKVPVSSPSALGEDFIPAPRVVQAMSFGFDAMFADYHWLQAVQIAGGTDIVGHDEAEKLGRLIDVVTTLNPHVGHPYRFGAIWLTHDPEQVREGIRLMHRAIENHPDDWRNYFYIGFNHFFYLGEYAEAAEILEAALELPGRPAYLQRLVARLKSQQGDIDVAALFLQELLRSSQDEEERARIQAGLDEIEIEFKARHLDRARAAYQELSGGDIRSVVDLVRGPHRVIERLPNPEPEALPEPLRRGSVWEIDDTTGKIVSSYLGSRYELHYSPIDRQRVEAWQGAEEDNASDGARESREESQNHG